MNLAIATELFFEAQKLQERNENIDQQTLREGPSDDRIAAAYITRLAEWYLAGDQ